MDYKEKYKNIYMEKFVIKLKNCMRKKFRIVNNDLSEEGKKDFHPYWFRIEQRRTLLFFFHWWSTPEFEPPHYFENDCDAMKHIKEHYPNAIVYDYYSENKCKSK